ncbi:MAG TPA: immunogenic protein [Rhodospirillaceae bacterium]|nr:immunogenic protein [Candidatus Neomarinimicrobiota bacterium]HCX14407.1 immunogenic protein [Rhodospirillaceae bacterium]
MLRRIIDCFQINCAVSIKLNFVVFILAALFLISPGSSLDAQDMRVIRIGAGPTGATDFPFGGLIANAISNPPGSRECEKGGNCGVPGLIAVAQTTIDAVENLKAISRGDMEMALSQADVTAWAYRGTAAFQNQPPLDNLRVLARLYPESVHLVVREGSPIKSVLDLRGRTVSMGVRDSGTSATARLILSAYGVKWNSVRMKSYGFAQSTEALANESIDAFFMVSGAPVLALEDFATRVSISLVPINGPTAEKLTQIFPYYTLGTIPSGTYGNHSVIQTVDVGSVLVARDDMNSDLAYGIVRAIWHERNVSLFRGGHPRGKLMDKSLAARDIGVPVLAGADRYYIENKLMDPPLASPNSYPVKGSVIVPAVPIKKASISFRTGSRP